MSTTVRISAILVAFDRANSTANRHAAARSPTEASIAFGVLRLRDGCFVELSDESPAADPA